MFQSISQSVQGVDSSRQLALGVALGMMIGILPKDNLLVGGLLVALILSGANFVTGILMCFSVSFLNSHVDPLFHRCGEWLMQLEYVLIPLSKFMQLPLAPWTRLDNTVVFGSFASGLIGFLPVYLGSFYCFDKNRDFIKSRITESFLFQWILGNESSKDRELNP